MKFPEFLRVFGDTTYRGACPSEAMEQVTFFNRLRSQYPETWGRIALHPRNEGKRTPGQVYREKSEGMAEGAPDIVIPPGFISVKLGQYGGQCCWGPRPSDNHLFLER